MPRRTGKAATRRARQQKRAKQGPTPAVPSSPPVVSEDPPDVPSTTVTTSGVSSPRPKAQVYAAVGASSRLGDESEYHYVVSDLRNTGILVVIMAVMLAVAVVIVNVVSAAP